MQLTFGNNLVLLSVKWQCKCMCTWTCLPNRLHSTMFPSGPASPVALFNPSFRVTVLEIYLQKLRMIFTAKSLPVTSFCSCWLFTKRKTPISLSKGCLLLEKGMQFHHAITRCRTAAVHMRHFQKNYIWGRQKVAKLWHDKEVITVIEGREADVSQLLVRGTMQVLQPPACMMHDALPRRCPKCSLLRNYCKQFLSCDERLLRKKVKERCLASTRMMTWTVAGWREARSCSVPSQTTRHFLPTRVITREGVFGRHKWSWINFSIGWYTLCFWQASSFILWKS